MDIFDAVVFFGLISSAGSLTCLHCEAISQPRHCKVVAECLPGEVCGVKAKTSQHGRTVYDVYCVHPAQCTNATNSGVVWGGFCRECCTGDLCNARGCSQPGYPVDRGQVCYNCQLQNQPDMCREIEICDPGQVCKATVTEEFGDFLYSSGCSNLHDCDDINIDIAPIIGRRSFDNDHGHMTKAEMIPLGEEGHQIMRTGRTSSGKTCQHCCAKDLCNHHCNGSAKGIGRFPELANPCHHGVCQSTQDGFICLCDADYTGDHCQIEINYCRSNHCLHGSCSSHATNYSCTCFDGYSGRDCEIGIDLCSPNPCANGRCINGVTNYTCNCDRSYTGINCTEMNYCRSNHCLHGSCSSHATNYSCTCFDGYSGRDCEIGIDLCSPNPCANGRCINGVTNYTCNCDRSYTGINCTDTFVDCYDIKKYTNATDNGVYAVKPDEWNITNVVCDMTTTGGGWTVFQYRFDGAVDFYRNFSEYENGFGDLNKEFWLGLKSIRKLVANGTSELRIDLTASDNTRAYETYKNFRLDAAPFYTLHIDRGIGTAGDASEGLSYTNNYRFVTYDRDNTNRHCAEIDRGGWWHKDCTYANLNGHYTTPGTVSSYNSGEGGVTFRDFKGVESLKTTKMMFRRY